MKSSSSSAATSGGAMSEIIFDTLQALIEILIGLSQYEYLCIVFANELPIIEPQTPVNTTAAASFLPAPTAKSKCSLPSA